MAGTVAGCRDQGDLIGKPGVAGDEVRSAGIGHRLHRVVENSNLVRLLAIVAPVLVFGSAEHVARIGKSRHPFPVHQAGVPADMVDMQMGAQHGVDAVGRKAGFAHGFEERTLPVVPGRQVAALLVVAEPGIDHDPAGRRLHHQRVDRHFEPALVGGEMRNQPGRFADFLIAGERLQLNDFRDFDLAHFPVHSAFPLSLLRPSFLGGARCWFPPWGAMDHPTCPRVDDLQNEGTHRCQN